MREEAELSDEIAPHFGDDVRPHDMKKFPTKSPFQNFERFAAKGYR